MSKAIKIGWLFAALTFVVGAILGGLIGSAIKGGGGGDIECPVLETGGVTVGTGNGTGSLVTKEDQNYAETDTPPAPGDLMWGATAGPLTRSITPITSPAQGVVNIIMPSGISVKSDFDAGNIFVKSLDTNGVGELLIYPDPFSPQDNKTFLAKFLFKVTGARGVRLNLTILNAEDVNVASDKNASRWDTYRLLYQPRASYDYKNWFQIPHSFDTKTINIQFTPVSDTIWFAYYPPYPLAHLEQALGAWGLDPLGMVSINLMGTSLLGQPLYLVTVGTECKEKLKYWVTAGQHPSEVQGSYFVEGMVDSALAALSSDSSASDNATSFFQEACLFLTPTLNPDGMKLGHHRTNAIGHNLNRVWDVASEDTSPEIYFVEKMMEKIGVDFYIDAHADEDNDGIFVFYAEGICAWNSTFTELKDAFNHTLITTYPAFNGILPSDGSYDPDPPCEAALKYSDNWVGNRFSVVAGTLEMPFQDVATHSNITTGFGPEQAYELGGAVLDAFMLILPQVKAQRAGM